MRPHVRFQIGDREAELGHGDIIGRLASAALCLDDARVSEAHAMVSLRAGVMVLLALRRRFYVEGDRLVSEAELEPGMLIKIVSDVELAVEDVVLPPTVVALAVGGRPGVRPYKEPLHNVASLVDGEHLLQHSYVAGAKAHIWSTAGAWRLQLGDDPARDLKLGDHFQVDDAQFELCQVPLVNAAIDPTFGHRPQTLELLTHYDTVHVHVHGSGHVLSVSGIAAKILSELAAIAAPVCWQALATEFWPAEEDRMLLRRKWDVSLSRLRRKLRDAGVRTNLVRADGHGHFELLLYPGDRVRDES